MRDLRPGAELAGYRIEAIEREGGGESVLRAHSPADGREVALHIPAQPAGSVSAARFIQRAHRLQGVAHPHLLTVYDAVTVEGRALAIAQAPPGRRLDGLLPLAPTPATRIARQVASAVQALEGAGAALPPLTPEHVWISADQAYLDALDGRDLEGRGEDPPSAAAAVADLLDDMVDHGAAPAPLRAVVARAREGAYFSAGQIVEALDRLEAGTASQARRRRRLALAVAALATLLLLAIVLVAVV